jgi:protein-S-isoprenylcysteine O-methyltransferase Ste14
VRTANTHISKTIARFALVLLLPVSLFFIAGRWDWWQGWVFIGVYILSVIISRALVALKNPDLIKERARFTKAEGVKSWDKIIAPIVVFLPLLVVVIAALNVRYAWPPQIPLWLQFAGLAGMVLGYAFSTWAMLSNRFFSAAVRIQTDRGHSVVSAGPYRFIRHPGYAGGVLFDLCFPLLLGSLWALVPTGIVLAMVFVRTVLEDRTLQEELPGYKEYAERVRYRLLPGIW